MLLILKTAWLNLGRNFRRTFLTLASIAIGMAVLFWLQCILEGRNRHIVESITSAYIGQLQVYDARYLKDKQVQLSISDKTQVDWNKLLPSSSAVTSRIHLPSLISSGEQSSPVQFTGIDPSREGGVTLIPTQIVAGAFLSSEADCKSKEILLGKSLAQLLGVEPGNKVVLLAQAADGTLGNDLFRVKGIYQSRSDAFDKINVFSNLACLSQLAVISGVHEFTIKLPPGADEEKVRAQLARSLPAGLSVTSWREVVPSMAGMVKFNNAMFSMLSLILFAVITIGIVNTLLMSVFERTREFGVMMALGTTPKQILTMVLAESLILGLAAAAFGLVLGLSAVGYHHLYGFDLHPFLGENRSIDTFTLDMVIYPGFHLIAYLSTLAHLLIFITVAAIYPATRAARLNPIDAIRFQ